MSKKSYTVTGVICIFISIVCLSVALVMFTNHLNEEKEAESASSSTLVLLQESIVNTIRDNHVGNQIIKDTRESIVSKITFVMSSADKILLRQGNNTDFSVHQRDTNREMPVNKIDGAYYIGIVTIPDIELELPVQSTWSYPKLKKTPCRYYGSLFTNDLVIAGHNYPAHFGMLKDLQIGADIIFTDTEGTIYKFKVKEKEILNPSEVKRLTKSSYPLTLFTCTVGGATRTVIRCEPTK